MLKKPSCVNTVGRMALLDAVCRAGLPSRRRRRPSARAGLPGQDPSGGPLAATKFEDYTVLTNCGCQAKRARGVRPKRWYPSCRLLSRRWPFAISESLLPTPARLNVVPPILAGPRPATDRSVQETLLLPTIPIAPIADSERRQLPPVNPPDRSSDERLLAIPGSAVAVALAMLFPHERRRPTRSESPS